MNIKTTNMKLYGMLLVNLLLGACQEEIPTNLHTPATAPLATSRIVATVYRIRSAEHVPCYQQPNVQSSTLSLLKDGELLDLPSLQETLVPDGTEYWLRLLPRSAQREGCYINVRQLVPES